MNNHTIIGIDLAKTVFQVGIMNDRKIISNKKVKRVALLKLIANLPISTIVMEACYSAHYWAREFEALDHTVKLIPAQHVKPFTRGLLGSFTRSQKKKCLSK